MRVRRWTLFEVPLVIRGGFRTGHSTVEQRPILVLRLETDEGHGWSECSALPTAGYSGESVATERQALLDDLLPRLLERPDVDTDVDHLSARAAIEVALFDVECRRDGVSFAHRLGAVRDAVPAGVAIGFGETPAAVAEQAASYVVEGYRRVKIKIAPGRDLEVLRAVRERVGDDVEIFADANGAYSESDLATLVALEKVSLACLEQPFAADNLTAHAALARASSTPICLDESVISMATLRAALDVAACSVVNLKWSRVGGIGPSLAILDECQQRGVDVWIGGMLSSGLGRAVDVALASLAPVTMTGDISASRRYLARDLTAEFVIREGTIAVPTGPGLGVEVDGEYIEATASETWHGEVPHRPN